MVQITLSTLRRLAKGRANKDRLHRASDMADLNTHASSGRERLPRVVKDNFDAVEKDATQSHAQANKDRKFIIAAGKVSRHIADVLRETLAWSARATNPLVYHCFLHGVLFDKDPEA